MPNHSQSFWNEKFNNEEYLYGLSPNEYIKEKSKFLKNNSNILCLGEGEGRNALFLSKEGHKITSIDLSQKGLEKSKKLLELHGHELETILLDLNEWNPAEKTFDAITTSYLHLPKPLFSQIIKNSVTALKKDACFIGEFFSKNQIAYQSGGPKSADMLYTTDDFLEILENEQVEIIELKEEIVFLNEGKGHHGDASVIRICFRKSV